MDYSQLIINGGVGTVGMILIYNIAIMQGKQIKESLDNNTHALQKLITFLNGGN